MDNFDLDPRLAADTLHVGDFPLCRLLLMNDAVFPWFILVPMQAGLVELYDLSGCEQAQFWRECRALGDAMRRAFDPYKLNVAAIGNVVRQLHIHHVARQLEDSCWPRPVWGHHQPQPMTEGQQLARIEALCAALEYPEFKRAVAVA